ncbi:uncharacterized protein LOC106663276 [Cimex lectularius]|uniref:N-acetyltransferase domain-containing protein n=1 Tax=Cimex lectularius TaxID=79782 RepID=A0A8I6RGK5_CIMLE|nr:uncharacterized protein LOC106663276 [Cimex lectularius]
MLRGKLLSKLPLTYTQKRFKEVTPCWLPICGVEIKKIPRTNTEKCRVASFLAKHYFPDEPVLVAAGLNSEKPNPGILQYLLTGMNDDMALYAMVQESREILGVAIARSTTPTTVYELRSYADKLGMNTARRYMHFLSQVEERANIYKSFQTEKSWSIDLLAVNKLFRRRGIAKMLLDGMKDMATRNKSFEVMHFTASNLYGSQAAYKCGGLKSHFKRPLSSYKDALGVPWITRELCVPHTSIEVFTRNLKAALPPEKKPEPTCYRYGLEKYDEV